MFLTDKQKATVGKSPAIILDLDGVITQTAKVHALAWKKMFDEMLKPRAEEEGTSFIPFSIEEDYPTYVDGKPRYDGVRSFLESRSIKLPDGKPDDPPEKLTVCGLGNRKNKKFLEIIQKDGVEVFDDTVEQVKKWRRQGKKTAVVSSSKNCAKILESAKLNHLFDERVDGVTAVEKKLTGKPAPDIFLYAADKLNVEPQKAVVIEDAPSGVKAGSAGNFGLVVGIARRGQDNLLKENGADVVVHNLKELD